MANQLASPGGFGLVKMLSSVMSPFAGKSKARPEKAEPKGEWEEASLDQILDWTIKSRVRLECHPPSCLPNTMSEGWEDWIKALQYWEYVTDDSSKNANKLEGTLEPTKASKASDMDSSSTLLAKRLVNAVSGPNAFHTPTIAVRRQSGYVEVSSPMAISVSVSLSNVDEQN
jgi:hypothetical protein